MMMRQGRDNPLLYLQIDPMALLQYRDDVVAVISYSSRLMNAHRYSSSSIIIN